VAILIRTGGPLADVLGDTSLQSKVLEDLSGAVNYRRWLADLARPFLGDSVLEIGSGIGDYAAEWAHLDRHVTASEADPARISVLRDRFASHSQVSVRELAVPLDADGSYTAVVAYNVLEHIPDDVAALQAFQRLVRPGGSIVLIVPAHAFAFSRFDAAIGHQRRYTTATLREALENAGLSVQRLHYVNPLGLVAWVVGVRVLRMTPRNGRLLQIWDARVVPVLRRLERRGHPPFGQSVFAVAHRVD
jgi:SAM-dependent methyltransferase